LYSVYFTDEFTKREPDNLLNNFVTDTSLICVDKVFLGLTFLFSLCADVIIAVYFELTVASIHPIAADKILQSLVRNA